MGTLIGLDFGTATTAAVIVPGELPTPEELWSEPLIVARTLPSNLIRGSGGVDHWQLAADGRDSNSRPDILHGLKRVLATTCDDPRAEAYLRSHALDVERKSTGELTVAGTLLSQLAGAMYRGLHERLIDPRSPPAAICLTFPGYVAAAQIAAIREAFESDSSAPLVLCSEAAAVAAVYSFGKAIGPDRRVAFVNIGAGQSWAAIVYFGAPDTYELLAEQGDIWLGGDDFDARLASLIQGKLTQADPNLALAIEQNQTVQKRLLSEAEVAKRGLSNLSEVEVLLPFLLLGPEGRPRHFRLSVSRAELEAAAGDLLTRLQSLCQEALKASGLQHYDIDHLVLLGGQVQSPSVVTALSDPVPSGGVFGRRPHILDPRKVPLALGAALLAARMVSRPGTPRRLSDTCGAGFPLVLQKLERDLWLDSAQLLATYPEVHDWPPDLQAKIVRATAKVTMEEAMEALHTHGEAGLDTLIEQGSLHRSVWSFWPFR